MFGRHMILNIFQKVSGQWIVVDRIMDATSVSWSETAQGEKGETVTKCQYVTNVGGVVNRILTEDDAVVMDGITERVGDHTEVIAPDDLVA